MIYMLVSSIHHCCRQLLLFQARFFMLRKPLRLCLHIVTSSHIFAFYLSLLLSVFAVTLRPIRSTPFLLITHPFRISAPFTIVFKCVHFILLSPVFQRLLLESQGNQTYVGGNFKDTWHGRSTFSRMHLKNHTLHI